MAGVGRACSYRGYRALVAPGWSVLLLVAVVFLNIPSGCGNVRERSTPVAVEKAMRGDKEAAALLAKASGVHGERLEKRMDAATRLAGHEGAEAWLILLLLQTTRTDYPSQDEKEMAYGGLRQFELAVTAAAITGLPKKTTPAVLWCLTLLLSEEGRGRWSTKTAQMVAEFRSPPIRELARERLMDQLGVDHGWDIRGWQDAILKMPYGH